jgi:hypothetical protein
MPTPRFVVVSAPLEMRVATSLASQAQRAVMLAVRIGRDVNDTLNRECITGDKAAEVLDAFSDAGGGPLVVFLLLVVVLSIREILLRAETRRILGLHNLHARAVALPSTGHQHED